VTAQNKALAAEAHKLADDLAYGHYAMPDAISMIRRLAVALDPPPKASPTPEWGNTRNARPW